MINVRKYERKPRIGRNYASKLKGKRTKCGEKVEYTSCQYWSARISATEGCYSILTGYVNCLRQ